MKNTTLGLLVTLTVIASLNQFGSLVEGMDNPVTIGDDNANVSNDTAKIVLTNEAVKAKEMAKEKLSDLKQQVINTDNSTGVDKEDIKAAIMPKNSKQIPLDPNMNSSNEVHASQEGMLNTSAKMEGFASYSAF